MAQFCNLCGKKMGFLDTSYTPAGTTICEDCYYTYKRAYDTVGNTETFAAQKEAFVKLFPENEVAKQLGEHLNNLHESKLKADAEAAEQEEEKRRVEEASKAPEPVILNENIGPFENQDLVYTIDGVRGRHIDIYKNRVVITTSVTIGSIISNNATDGEKTIYFCDCIGIQFKQSGLAIGFLQLETASCSGNNKSSNFFDENSFTFDTSVISNERMFEVLEYVKARVNEIKVSRSGLFVADELLKLKQLLDMGALTQDEFDSQKQKLLNL